MWFFSTNAPKGILKYHFEGHRQVVFGLAFAPNGKFLATVSSDQSLRTWNLGTSTAGLQIVHDKGLTAVAISTDNHTIAVACCDGFVYVYSAQCQSILKKSEGYKGALYSVDFSPDGKYIIYGGEDQTVRIWDYNSPAGVLKAVAAHQVSSQKDR